MSTYADCTAAGSGFFASPTSSNVGEDPTRIACDTATHQIATCCINGTGEVGAPTTLHACVPKSAPAEMPCTHPGNRGHSGRVTIQ